MTINVFQHKLVARFSKILVAASLISLVACGSNSTAHLPDDTTSEKAPDSSSGTVTPKPVTSTPTPTPTPSPTPVQDVDETAMILQKYDYLDPQKIVPTQALTDAILYFYKNQSQIKNKNYLSVINFAQNSREKRFYIIDMNSGSVWAIHVAHGKGSDPDFDGYAQTFSNDPGSNASSLGFYMTAETYDGEHGLSLRLDGLSSTNSNVRDRAIVIHGADYVQESNVIAGRSWGCPAVAMENRDAVVNALKGGSLIYASVDKAGNTKK
jgi:hypothetical protein